MNTIKNYIWFIKESQSFMAGHNSILVFLQSLFKGIKFCINMKEWDRYEKKYGKIAAYCMLNRTMET